MLISLVALNIYTSLESFEQRRLPGFHNLVNEAVQLQVPKQLNAIASVFGDINMTDGTKIVGIGFSDMIPHLVQGGRFNRINSDEDNMKHICEELTRVKISLPQQVADAQGSEFYLPTKQSVARNNRNLFAGLEPFKQAIIGAHLGLEANEAMMASLGMAIQADGNAVTVDQAKERMITTFH